MEQIYPGRKQNPHVMSQSTGMTRTAFYDAAKIFCKPSWLMRIRVFYFGCSLTKRKIGFKRLLCTLSYENTEEGSCGLICSLWGYGHEWYHVLFVTVTSWLTSFCITSWNSSFRKKKVNQSLTIGYFMWYLESLFFFNLRRETEPVQKFFMQHIYPSAYSHPYIRVLGLWFHWAITVQCSLWRLPRQQISSFHFSRSPASLCTVT